MSREGVGKAAAELLSALDYFPEANIIFTRPNADHEGREIIRLIDAYVSNNPHRARVYTSLGQVRYLSAIKHVDVVIGNSSSGILEAPALATPSVNIGNRQRGRLLAASVINCAAETTAIVEAIKKALSPQMKPILEKMETPYYSDGQVSVKIKEILKKYPLDHILVKSFYDLNMDGYTFSEGQYCCKNDITGKD